ncbi:MAG: hypothetical protein IAA97_03905 [Spirochaetes bacterium]|uniref:Uncharacterized protein n=1 Tax=Candidatus Ornithospirochaeta stercoripullorum TaxID=2840899 RepID=A0A9D9DXX6_9SPIO|nr:hypothetical protein [Candidatus Ornithospirochaeta stercoripullorum]
MRNKSLNIPSSHTTVCTIRYGGYRIAMPSFIHIIQERIAYSPEQVIVHPLVVHIVS